MAMASSRPLSLSGEGAVSPPKSASNKTPRRSNSFSFRLNSPRTPKTSTPKDSPSAAAAFPFPTVQDAAETSGGRKSTNLSRGEDSQKIPFTLNKSKLVRKISDIKTVIEMESETERIKNDSSSILCKSLYDDPDTYKLEDGEKRTYLAPISNQMEPEKLQDLLGSLKDWINFELGGGDCRMQVSSLEEDLRDGLIIGQLMSKLAKQDIQMPFGKYVQSDKRQFNNLQFVLNKTLEILSMKQNEVQWKPEDIWVKNLLACVCLLVDIVTKFHGQVSIDLPASFSVRVVHASKKNGINQFTVGTQTIQLPQRKLQVSSSEDPFDAMMEGDTEKHRRVQNKLRQKMTEFANRNLRSIGKQLNGEDLGAEFKDGTRLILLVGQLAGFFVPLYNYNPEPKSRKDELANAEFALELLKDLNIGDEYEEIGLKPDVLIKGDEDAILRILYHLFQRFK